MHKPSFLEELERRVLVCDGAMGTMLYARGVFLNRSFDELNLTQPDLVTEVHHAYVRAGADVIETNTFGANRIKLSTFGLADRTAEINTEGARLARRAAHDQAFVAGAIGPLGVRIEPWGKTGIDEAETYFREQGAALRAIGAALTRRFHDSQLGTIRPGLTLEDGTLVATDNYIKVRIAPGLARNRRVRVKLTGLGTGEVVSCDREPDVRPASTARDAVPETAAAPIR